MEWAKVHEPAAGWIVSTSVDTPFVPHDLVAKFREAQEANQAELACAWSNGRIHPVTGLWGLQLAGDLRRALIDEDLRKVEAWAGRHRMVTVDFPTDPIDPFFNINRPEDLAKAEALLASHSGTLV
jgi:molybdopterin-guanine dinucleotide biosynthesis protein A